MAERAHPEDPGFAGTVHERIMRDRYAFCLPFVQGKHVLDAPCGTGWGTSLLSGCASLAALDIDFCSVRYGQQHFPGVFFVAGDLGSLPLAAAHFDVVICVEGLEHVCLSSAALFLAEARRVLKPGGLFIATAPLLCDGRHSGNPYHLYEFTEADFRQVIEQHFAIETLEVIEDEWGKGIRVTCRPSAHPRGDAMPREPVPVQSRALEWLRRMHSSSGFRFSERSEPSLIATSIGVLILEGAGELPGLSAEERGRWRDYLQGCQGHGSGMFRDPLLDRFPVESEIHDRRYLDHMFTYFALQALHALGERARQPLRFMEEFSAGTVAAWLESLNWSNPWLESNRIMFVLACLIYRAEAEGDRTAPETYHAILDWLERAQDQATGLWGTESGASPLNAVAGAFHFLPFYRYVNRPLCCLGKMAETCVSLQSDDGLFAARPGGGACEDLDAVVILAMLALESPQQAGEVKKRLLRAFWALYNLQNPDGGFPHARRDSAETHRFGNWLAMEAEFRQSDTFSTWFRLTALHVIRTLYPADVPDIGAWRFRKWPALGYFPGASWGGERETMHLWLQLFRTRGAAPVTSERDEPVVSVIVTCHNLGIYLFEAIQSALNQEEVEPEIIVVDDGSTDEFTLWYLRQIDAPRTRVVFAQHQGLPAARNSGIRAARGRYICCLDADDRLKPAFLARASQVLNSSSDVGFVSCHYKTFDGENSVYRFNDCRFPELLARNEAVGVSVFRKEAWSKAGGYCSDLSGMEDWDFWIGILEAGYRAVVIPEVLFEYRKRAGSMYTVTSRPENYSRITNHILRRHEDSYRKWFDGVITLKTKHFIELLEVRRLESESYRRERAMMVRSISQESQIAAERAAWIQELEKAKEWFAGQLENWQRIAAERAATVEGLENASKRLTEELREWQRLAGQSQAENAELQAKVESLVMEAGHWKAAFADLGGQLAETEAALRHCRSALAESSRPGLLGWMRTAALLVSPRFARSGARNLLLWIRLRRTPEARKVWAECFDAGWYLDVYPDVQRSRVPAVLHYLICGCREGRNPSGKFDTREYLVNHPDVRLAGVNPLLHYALFGRSERDGLEA